MRFGLTILPEHRWSVAAPMWRRAQELGFDHAWTYDHLVWGGLPDSPWYGTIPTLTAEDDTVDVCSGADAAHQATARDVVQGQEVAHERHRVPVVR